MIRRGKAWVVALASLSSAFVAAHAGDLRIEAAYTAVGQQSDDPSLDESTTGSLDFLFGWTLGSGLFEGYIEANSSLKGNGVATMLPRSNADAGTALDPDRAGRAQLSELKYTYEWPSERTISGGLLDPSAYLDVSRIDNDENQQFLGASFVNNPTIEFPDYTLGFRAKLSSADSPRQWQVVLTSSNGIADNPHLSYSQLLNFAEDEKGLFAAVEAAWPAERYSVQGGAWVNTAEHDSLDGTGRNARNHGAYTAIGTSRELWATNLRLGLADPDVSLAEGFASLSVQRQEGKGTVGFAGGRTWVSGEAGPGVPSHSAHLEGYFRLQLGERFFLSPSIQYLVNGRFDTSGSSSYDDVTVFSLRLHHVYFSRP